MSSRCTLTRVLTTALSALALTAAATAGPAAAAVNVTVSGTVVDLSGTPVAGVMVGTDYSASRDTTDSSGHFSFPIEDQVKVSLMFFTDWSKPGYVQMKTQPVTISGGLDLGTATLPYFPTKTVRIVDSADQPVYQAYTGGCCAHSLATGWADAGHHLTPSLTVADAWYYLSGSSDANGEFRAVFPVMSNGGLPSVPVQVNSGDGVYGANLDEASGTNPHTVKITGYTVGPPNPASAVTASASTVVAGQASVHWGLALPNGSAVTGYTVTAVPSGATKQVSADQQDATFTGLAGVSHTFTVTAHSSAGSVTSSPSNPVVPASLPSTPPDLRATSTGTGQFTITWGPSDGNGTPINGYRFEFAGTPGDTFRYPDQRSVVLDRLSPGSYTLRVWALSRYGESAPATVTFDVPTAPAPTPAPSPAPTPTAPVMSAPTKMNPPKVAVRGRKAIVKWQAAVSNSSPITRYLIDISKGRDKTASASARKTVFKRLKPGRYRIRIAAQNASGTSPYSVWVKVRIR